jgi:SRSO17 transposase
MNQGELAAVRPRLEEFAAEVFAPLTRADQRDKGQTYLRGLLLDGRRKSMQPMAERLGVDHQGLQQFVSSSTWAVEPVRQRLAARAVEVITPEAWVVDDTGFPKDGTASPGVARQYSGTLGKVANCQIGVSVQAVTDAASCPLDWRLFLPERWDDATAATPEAAAAIRARRARAGIGDDVRHRAKWRLALDMLDELAGWGLTPPVVVADAGYGDAAEFRDGIAERGWTYVVQVTGDQTAYPAEAVPEVKPYSGRGRRSLPRYRTTPVGLRAHALAAGRDAAVALTWRQGSRGSLTSHFVALRVRPPGRRTTGRLAAGCARAHRHLAVEPARGHAADRAGPAGQDPLADRTRLPRTQDRPRAGPLRGPHLRRLAPPRHLGHRRLAVPHHPASRPKSGCAGLSLYAVLHELQALLATWTGVCIVCGSRIDTHPRAPT